MARILKNSDIDEIDNNQMKTQGGVMKSNITKMVTLCMCMMVVSFASEKQHLTEQQLQSPVSIISQDVAQDKADAYSASKKEATYQANKLAQVQSPSESRDIKRIKEMMKNQIFDTNKPQTPSSDYDTSNEYSNEYAPADRDTEVEVYVCTDYYYYESSWNVCNDDAGWCVYDPAYYMGYSYECASVYMSLPDGNYTLHLNDDWGDGGLSAGVYLPGAGTLVEYFSCMY